MCAEAFVTFTSG